MNAWRFIVTLTILVGGAWTALTAGEAEPRSSAPGKQSARTKRLVQPGTIDVRAMTKGTIWAYRPIAK